MESIHYISSDLLTLAHVNEIVFQGKNWLFLKKLLLILKNADRI